MTVFFRSLLASLTLVCHFTAANASQPTDTIALIDDSGEQVSLEKPPNRIVSLAPHITESLFAVGAGEKIIGTVSYSDYPEKATDIPLVGSYDRINLESVVSMQPDLVVAWLEGNGPAVVERLRSLGIPVFVSNPTTLEEISDTLRDFGQLTGHPVQGETQATHFENRLEKIQHDYSNRDVVTVFYQVWDKPLLTISDDTLIADVIRLCGGENVFGEALATYPVTNVESILALNPDMILASGMGEERPEWLDTWKQWPSIRAVSGNHLYFIEPTILQRHSTHILDGADQLCAIMEKARETEPTEN